MKLTCVSFTDERLAGVVSGPWDCWCTPLYMSFEQTQHDERLMDNSFRLTWWIWYSLYPPPMFIDRNMDPSTSLSPSQYAISVFIISPPPRPCSLLLSPHLFMGRESSPFVLSFPVRSSPSSGFRFVPWLQISGKGLRSEYVGHFDDQPHEFNVIAQPYLLLYTNPV